jgi:hypothetical protein
LLGQRVDFAKAKLARKYKRAVRIYEVWEKDEVEGLDYGLKRSVNAGLKLGKETYDRLRFQGFDFEVEGEKHSAYYVDLAEFSVFGDNFDNFRDALNYASKAYRIPKAKLIEMFSEHENSFDKAIKAFHLELERKLYEKELKKLCGEFAKEHKQNVKFVMHTVEIYRRNNENMTIEKALKKLYEEQIKNWRKPILTPAK